SKPLALTAMRRSSGACSITAAGTGALLVISTAAARAWASTSAAVLRSWISTSPSGSSPSQELPSAASVAPSRTTICRTAPSLGQIAAPRLRGEQQQHGAGQEQQGEQLGRVAQLHVQVVLEPAAQQQHGGGHHPADVEAEAAAGAAQPGREQLREIDR